MEADASDEEIEAGVPVLDMYAGHADFREGQLQGEPNERTYVLTIDERRRTTSDTLWAAIQKVIDANGYTEPGIEAAEAIKAAIETAIAADTEMGEAEEDMAVY